MCKPCRTRQLTAACALCGKVKPVAGRDAAGQPICERCRRRGPGRRRACGHCGKTAPVAVRGTRRQAGHLRQLLPAARAVCSVCGRYRPCNFAGSEPARLPVVLAAGDRSLRPLRPGPAAGRPAGPKARSATPATPPRCAAGSRARPAARSGAWSSRPARTPSPAPTAPGCPSSAPAPTAAPRTSSTRSGRCARCSLRRRATVLLSAGTGDVPATLIAVLEAICAARTPRSRAELAAHAAPAPPSSPTWPPGGSPPPTRHSTSTRGPGPPGHLRQVLTAGGVLPPRDEELARTEQWLAALLDSIDRPRAPPARARLRHLAGHAPAAPRRRPGRRHRTYTARARNSIKAAAGSSAGSASGAPRCRLPPGRHRRLARHQPRRRSRPRLPDLGRPPRALPALRRPRPAAAHRNRDQRQPALGTGRPAAPRRQHRGHRPGRRLPGPALRPERHPHRRAHHQPGHPPRRRRHIRLGKHDIPVPPPLGDLLLTLITDGKPYTGIGTPAERKWLFPGLLPGQPITPARLAERLRALGIPVRAGRRAALTDLAAQVPAAVLADVLGLHPTTAVNWTHDAGSDWNRYAAELARDRNHQPGE